MRPILAIALAFAFAVLGLSASGAPVREPPVPFRLTISLDREEYFLREPIVVDWAFTNTGDRPLTIPIIVDIMDLQFHCRFAKDREVALWSNTIYDVVIPKPRLTLEPKESVRGWLLLRSDFAGAWGTGEFSLKATRASAYLEKASDEAVRYKLSSNEVRFKVIEPKGEDAAAHALIEETMSKQFPPIPPPEEPTPEKRRKWQEDAANRENYCERWFFSNAELCKSLLKTKSDRFRAAAACSLGRTLVSAASRGKNEYDQETLAKAVPYLKQCADSPGASRYLKGLARYHLLECKKAETGPGSKQEAIKLAEQLIADYSATAIAQDAQVILDELRPRKK